VISIVTNSENVFKFLTVAGRAGKKKLTPVAQWASTFQFSVAQGSEIAHFPAKNPQKCIFKIFMRRKTLLEELITLALTSQLDSVV